MGRTIALLACLFLIAPVAAQTPGIDNPYESTPTTMYMHINGFQDFPINTQKPSDKYAEEVRVGTATHSMCVETPLGTATYRSEHTWYGYSSPSIVEYDVDDGGKPRIHQERGLSFDVELDQSVDPVFKWFLAGAVPFEPPQGTESVHPPIPNVIVRAIVRQGDEISIENAAFNTGEVIAQGQTDPATLAGDMTDSPFVTVHEREGRYVYEFTIPLEYERGTIDREESYNIRVDAYIDEPLCQGPNPGDVGDYMMLDYVLVHTSPEFRPRLDWAIMNPLKIEALHPQLVGDMVAIHTASNSPWGSYDVQGDLPTEPQMVLEIDGPSEAISVERVKMESNTRGHDKHDQPNMAVWVWNYQADQAKPGIYTFTLRIQNDQQNAEAEAVATFQLGNGGEGEVCSKNVGDDELICESIKTTTTGKESPGVALLPMLAALGAALLVRRR